MVESGGLENRYRGNSIESSNLSFSALSIPFIRDFFYHSKRKIMHSTVKINSIAPCGMNCVLCYAFQREKNSCPGCRADNREKPITRLQCKIKTCYYFKDKGNKYCNTCNDYPCKNLAHLDKRYRAKYEMSMIENLNMINESGIRKFILNEDEKWKCRKCGEYYCVHKKKCLNCNK